MNGCTVIEAGYTTTGWDVLALVVIFGPLVAAVVGLIVWLIRVDR